MSIENSKSWTDFLTSVRSAKLELGNPEIVWYRGQWDYSNYLLPSLLRYKNGLEKEQLLFHKFQRFADKVFKSKESEWETLFDMQHYGIPTRLLDWTESFGIALYFASYYNNLKKSKEDAALYIMDPLKLNDISGIKSILKIPREEHEFPYSGIYWNNKPFKASAPIAIEPIFKNDRIMAQRGTFTVHHHDINPIENIFPNAIKKITLKNDAISAAIEFLDLANLNEYSVFPDLAGISQYLNNSSGLIPRWP
jgi:hypothetical protein